MANFVSVFNSDKVTVKKINGKDAIVFNNDADIDSKTINKIKQIFPDVEIQQVVSNSGATIEYSFKTIDDVPIDFAEEDELDELDEEIAPIDDFEVVDVSDDDDEDEEEEDDDYDFEDGDMLGKKK